MKWTARSLLEEAAEAERLGDLARAAESLSSYVRLMPGEHEVLARYGILCTRLGDSDPRARATALRILARVLEVTPQRQDIRRAAGRVALRLGFVPQAKAHLETLLEAIPEDGEAESLLGECHLILERYEDAGTWFDRATRHAPDRIENYVQLAYLMRGYLSEARREQFERKLGRSADKVIDDLVAANPRSSRSYLERARYRRKFGVSLPAVEEDLARAYSLAPDDVDVILARARWAYDNHRADEARDYLERGTRRHPRDGALHRALAILELQANRTEAGIRHMRQAVECLPGQKTLPWTFADLLVQAGELDEAHRIVGKLREGAVVSSRHMDYLEACLLMQAGDWLEASVILQSSNGAPELKGQANYWLARCYKQLGDLDQQLATERLLVAIEPRSARDRRGLGLTLLSLGLVDEAIVHFRELTKLRGKSEDAWVALAQALILREIRRPEADRGWRAVEEAVDRAARAIPDSPRVVLLRSEISAARRQFDRAYRTLVEARGKWPERVECWVALAGTVQRDRRSEEASAILDEAQRRLGDTVPIRLGRAHYLAAQPTAEAPGALMDLARDLERFAEHDGSRLLDGLAAASFRVGAYAQAERLWSRLADRQPHNLRLRLVLLEVASRLGDRDSMDRILEEVRRACDRAPDPTRPRSSVDDLVREGARKRLDRLTSRRPTPERERILEAYISEVERDRDWAINPEAGISVVFLADAMPQ